MATRTCPQCGAQYVATVRRCIDCDVTLVDEAPPTAVGEEVAATGSVSTPLGAGDQIGYELEGWGNQLKVTLEGMLDKAGIRRAWEAGALVVSAADEEAVDDLIATLEGGDIDDLGDEEPRVALEIDGLDADGRAELDARLLAQAVPHAWEDDGALVVHEDDEEAVLAIIEEVFDADPGGDGGDGLAAQDALSAIYVAVDRLVKHPHERKLATAYVEAAQAFDGIGVPYGFGAADWADLVAEVDALAADVAPFADPSVLVEPADDADDADVGDRDAADAPDAADGAEPESPTDVDDVDDLDGEDSADPIDDRDAAAADGPADDDDEDDDAADLDVEQDEEDEEDRHRAAARELRARLVDLV